MTKATPCWSPRDSGLLGSAIAGRASAPSDKTRICWYKHLWLSPACPTAPHASRLSPACPTAPHACTHTTDRLTAAPQNPPGLSGARCSNTSGANASAMLRHASHAYALTVTHTGCVLSFGNRLLKAGLKSPPPPHTHAQQACCCAATNLRIMLCRACMRAMHMYGAGMRVHTELRCSWLACGQTNKSAGMGWLTRVRGLSGRHHTRACAHRQQGTDPLCTKEGGKQDAVATVHVGLRAGKTHTHGLRGHGAQRIILTQQAPASQAPHVLMSTITCT
jgi:hypothetical protein